MPRKRHAPRPPRQLWTRLQFGRGCYAAETRSGGEPAAPARTASIRPRLLCRGNSSSTCAGVGPRRLQFGRGCYAAETLRPGFRRRLLCRLQFGRGCYAAETSSAAFRPAEFGGCFNSAAAVMPRKRACQRRSALSARASIRPRLLCRGNAPTSPAGTVSASRFNSAAAVMPRKRAVRHPHARAPASFNSAAAVMPRKRPTPHRPTHRGWLQFGRGSYAAETT